MNKKVNIRRNVIIISALIIGVAIFIISMNDIEQIAETFRKADYRYMALSFLVIILYLFFEPLSLHICIRSRDKKISFVDSMVIATTSFFFNAITPFSSGGQPFQVYAYHKKNIKASESTGALLVNFIVYQIVAAVICGISLIFFYKDLSSKMSNINILIWIGFALVIINCLLFASIGLFQCVTDVIVKFCTWLKKFKLFRKINIDTLQDYCDNVHSGFKGIWNKPLNIFLVVLTKTFAWLLFYSVPFLVLKGVHADITLSHFWYTVGVASFTAVVVSFIPTPGGVGGAEFAFTILFIVFLKTNSQAISAMLVWRVVTYYFPALISFIFYLDFERRVGLDENRDVHR